MNIVIEGDAKACFDAIVDNSLAPWTISSLITNIIELSHPSCLVVFVGLGGEQMMLPPTVWDVCMRDVLALSV